MSPIPDTSPSSLTHGSVIGILSSIRTLSPFAHPIIKSPPVRMYSAPSQPRWIMLSNQAFESQAISSAVRLFAWRRDKARGGSLLTKSDCVPSGNFNFSMLYTSLITYCHARVGRVQNALGIFVSDCRWAARVLQRSANKLCCRKLNNIYYHVSNTARRSIFVLMQVRQSPVAIPNQDT